MFLDDMLLLFCALKKTAVQIVYKQAMTRAGVLVKGKKETMTPGKMDLKKNSVIICSAFVHRTDK